MAADKTDGILQRLPFLKAHGQKYTAQGENGRGQLTAYDIMPGLKLALTEYSGETMQFHHPVMPYVMQINYCFKGRMGWIMKNGSGLYLGSGGLSLHMMDCCSVSSISLPLGFYSGITLFADLAQLAEKPPEVLDGLGITAKTWHDKFCSGGELTVLPDVAAAAEIFAYLPRIGEAYRPAYFKLKAQELLLFLAMLDMSGLHSAEGCENQYIEIVKKVHARLTEHWQEHYTIESLSKEYLINSSLLKKVFKAVYGKPMAQYMKEYRMNKAAALLLKTGSSIAGIAAQCGYASQSKFAAAFKSVMQLALAEYRARYAAKKV